MKLVLVAAALGFCFPAAAQDCGSQTGCSQDAVVASQECAGAEVAAQEKGCCESEVAVATLESQDCPFGQSKEIVQAFQAAQKKMGGMCDQSKAELASVAVTGNECPVGKRAGPTMQFMAQAVQMAQQFHQAMADHTGEMPAEMQELFTQRADLVSALNDVVGAQMACYADLAPAVEAAAAQDCCEEIVEVSIEDGSCCEEIAEEVIEVAIEVSDCCATATPVKAATQECSGAAVKAAAEKTDCCAEGAAPVKAAAEKSDCCSEAAAPVKAAAEKPGCCSEAAAPVKAAAQDCSATKAATSDCSATQAATQECSGTAVKAAAEKTDCCAEGAAPVKAAAEKSGCCSEAAAPVKAAAQDCSATKAATSDCSATQAATQECSGTAVKAAAEKSDCCSEAAAPVKAAAQECPATGASGQECPATAAATQDCGAKPVVASQDGHCESVAIATPAAFCSDTFEAQAAEMVKQAGGLLACWGECPQELAALTAEQRAGLADGMIRMASLDPSMKPTLQSMHYYSATLAKVVAVDAEIAKAMGEDCCSTFKASSDLLSKAAALAAALESNFVASQAMPAAKTALR